MVEIEIDIKPEDIQEKFIRSRGKGGQNVNKVSSCVQLKHLPSGISVKCDIYRTQKKNRDQAMKMLIEKIKKVEEDRLNIEKSEFEKEKRKNRKRPKVLKEKILKDKKIIGEKKKLRKRIK